LQIVVIILFTTFVMAKCGIRKEKFSLHHTNVDRFHSSHWSSTGTTTGLYVIYRWVLALLMVAGIIAHIIDFSEKNPAWKWLIYMTNQGISLLTVHYIIYATITLLNYLLPRGFEYNATLPFFYKFSWAIQNMSSSAALFITIIYWSILHPIVVEEGMMTGPWKEFLNVFLHLLNTLSYLLDIFITARPTRIHHFYFAIIFGLWYMMFSLIYWAAGGTGFCYWEEVSKFNNCSNFNRYCIFNNHQFNWIHNLNKFNRQFNNSDGILEMWHLHLSYSGLGW